MPEFLTDDQALADFANERSQAAFEQIVARYVNLVFSSARRQVGSHQEAEDVTQDVFAVLARKAPMLVGRRVLASWLLRVTRNVSLDRRRREMRRLRREQKVAAMNPPVDYIAPTDAQGELAGMAPLLDAALAALSESDRQAIVLKFFQGRSDQESAQTMGINEVALRQRRFRALARMRAYFATRGVEVTAEVMATGMAAGAVRAAPEGLAGRVVAHAMTATHAAAASGAGTALLKGAIVMGWIKSNLAAVVVIVVLLCVGSGLILANFVGNRSVDSIAVAPKPALERRPMPGRFAPGQRIPARAYISKTSAQDFPGGLGYLDANTTIHYANVEFGSSSRFFLAAVAVPADLAGKQIVVHIDQPQGPIIARLTVRSTGGWGNLQTQSTPLANVQGTHDVYLGFTGNGVANLYWMQFASALAPASPTTRPPTTQPR